MLTDAWQILETKLLEIKKKVSVLDGNPLHSPLSGSLDKMASGRRHSCGGVWELSARWADAITWWICGQDIWLRAGGWGTDLRHWWGLKLTCTDSVGAWHPNSHESFSRCCCCWWCLCNLDGRSALHEGFKNLNCSSYHLVSHIRVLLSKLSFEFTLFFLFITNTHSTITSFNRDEITGHRGKSLSNTDIQHFFSHHCL